MFKGEALNLNCKCRLLPTKENTHTLAQPWEAPRSAALKQFECGSARGKVPDSALSSLSACRVWCEFEPFWATVRVLFSSDVQGRMALVLYLKCDAVLVPGFAAAALFDLVLVTCSKIESKWEQHFGPTTHVGIIILIINFYSCILYFQFPPIIFYHNFIVTFLS